MQFEHDKVYCCDNIELLKIIPDGELNLIYSDILYGTGRKLKDYQDLKANKQIIYDFYFNRIKELFRVLSSKGSIYLQMDYRISHWMRDMMDEVFGYKNFRNHIIWPREKSKGAKSKSRQYARNCDHILFYSKSEEYTWNGCFINYSTEYIKKRFRPDKNGRLFMDCPMGSHANKPIEELEAEDRIYVTSTNGKRYKRYLDELSGVAAGDVWDDILPLNSMALDNTGYSTQKPKDLMKRIIETSSAPGDLVADFFCGSGTCCIVAKELGRKYIGCDTNQNAINITNKGLE
jgi:DNA modification methylase